MEKDFIKELMEAVIVLENEKQELVKAQNFTDANKLRTAIKSLRELIKKYEANPNQ